MEVWARITAILCAYGVFKEIRPSEPYLTEYLEGPWLNFTKSEVNHEIYPVWTYSYLVCLLVVLLVTDFVRYKPVIIIEALAYIVTWSLLLWGRHLFAMQMMQAVYGVATSTEVAYYTYIYAVVSEDVFQKVTGYARGALLFGRFLSGILSQALTSSGLIDYHELNYISFTCVGVCFLISFALPKPERTLYFLRTSAAESTEERGCLSQYLDSLRFMLKELRKLYSDRNLLMWSVWWSVATSGNLQVGNYIQPLWETIYPTWQNDTGNAIYNGVVEASHTLLSSGAAITLGMIQERYLTLNEFVLSAFTLVSCGVLLIMAQTTYIWVAYVTYIAFRTVYQIVITAVTFHAAKTITPDTYGLVFGMNTFVALILQTIMTALFVDRIGLHLEPRMQYRVYSIYFGLLAIFFIALGTYRKLRQSRNTPAEATSEMPEKDFLPEN